MKVNNYKETLIGKIPEDWDVVRLGDSGVAEIRGNKSVNNVEKIAFIPMEFIPDSSIYTKYEIRNLNEIKSSTYCEAGDLLLAKITPSLENGKQGIVPEDVPNGFALATTEVFPIVCKGIDRLFLFYILKHPRFRKVLEYSMRGTTGRQRVPKEAVENLPIPYPPLSEQRKIAEILSTVDKAIQKVDEAIAKTERLKKGLMQELLTKGIGHTEFKDTEIGRIPKEWEVVKISDVVKPKDGIKRGPWGGMIKKEFFVERGFKVYEQKNVILNDFNIGNYYIANEKFNELKSYEIKPGDILITSAGTIGKIAIVPDGIQRGIFNQALIRIRLKSDIVSTTYFKYLFESGMLEKQLKKFAYGATQVNLASIKILKQILLSLPPLSEQQKIAEILSTVDKKLELEKKRKEKLERIKKGLMNDLLTGKRRVKV